MKLARITGVRAPVFLPPALPSAGPVPGRVRASRRRPSHEEIVRLRRAARAGRRWRAGSSRSRRSIDVRIDQAKTEIVIDRDKVASMGLTMQQVGADLSSMLGGNFVNRFNIDGRSYKVIPQVERAGAPDAPTAGRHPHHRARTGS